MTKMTRAERDKNLRLAVAMLRSGREWDALSLFGEIAATVTKKSRLLLFLMLLDMRAARDAEAA
jgi:hypothetical protein